MRDAVKKYLALFVVAVMLSGIMPVGVMASDETESGLLFEMDLTNYDGVDVSKITNSVTGNSSTITSGLESTAANYAVPKLGTAETGAKYLTMRRTGGETDGMKAMVVQVTDEAFSALDDFTIETWVRKDGGSLGGSRLFSMGNSSQRAGYADAMDSGSGTIYYNGNGTAGGNVGTYDIQVAKTAYNAEEWTHFVFTREWVAGENGAGTWKHAVYINGNQYGSTVEEEVTARTSQPGRLIIGGLSETSPRAAYGGDIGTFKVYSKVLSSNEALKNYKDSLTDFYPVESGLIFEMDLTNYDGVDVSKITNSVEGNSSTITSGVESTAANYAVPKLGTAETGTKYLTMRRTGGETDGMKAMVVQVTDEAFEALDDFTIETWVRKDSANLGGSRLFSMGKSPSAGYADAMDSGSGTIYYNGNGTAGGNVGTYDIQVAKTAYNAEEWTHFVFTREWVAGENGAGTWKHAVFINGNQYGSTVEEAVTARASQIGRLIIGGLSETSPRAAYGGDIGTFRVYNKVLDAGEITEEYDATKTLFASDEETNQPDGPDQPDQPEQPEEPNDILIIEEDMSRYTVEEAPAQTNMFVSTCRTEGNFSNTKVHEVSNKNGTESIKYIALGTDVPGSYDTYYGYKFPQAYTEDFVLDVNVRLRGTPQSRGLRWGTVTIIHDYMGSVNALTDDFGFYNLRYTFKKNDSGKYVVSCYDLLNNAKLVMSSETNNTSCPGLLLQTYVGDDSMIARGDYVDVSKYRLFRYITPSVTSTNIDVMRRNDEELIVKFSQDIKEESLKNLCIKHGDDTIASSIKAYNPDNREVTISLGEYLKYGEAYNIHMSGVENSYGLASDESSDKTVILQNTDITSSEIEFKNSNNESINSLGNNTDISATISLSTSIDGGAQIRMIMLLCDEKGIVRDVSERTSTLSSQSTPITACFDGGVMPKDRYEVRCFIWQVKDGINLLLNKTIFN